MSELFNVFPFVGETADKLNNLNKLLNKVTLTGKINALHIASNLFEFTDATSKTFEELKTGLSDSLLEENLQKVVSDLRSKSKVTIDILIRNLFERTADVGFLATDNVIIDFLNSDTIEKDDITNHLIEYVKKYSVYNEIVIFDTKGNAKVNINTNNNITNSTDSIISDALASDNYVEVYKKTDIFSSQEKTLVYAQRIQDGFTTIGVLCLCFKLEDELETIFENLSDENIIIALADKFGVISTSKTTSSGKNFIKYNDKEYEIVGSKNIAISSKASPYQGYCGISDWYSYAIDVSSVVSKTDNDLEVKKSRPTNLTLLNEKLIAIIEKADDLVEDLKDVIINGELIASKRKVYVLSPILDNLRDISISLIQTIKDSILNLEKLVEQSLINDTKMSSQLAIDIMDRNLYERANDSRWWALTREFQDELSSETPSEQQLSKTLSYINGLYTVYTNLYLYDNQGVIVAASNDKSVIGKKISKDDLSVVLSHKNTQNYHVSNFENSEFYNNKATYVYNATIHQGSKAVGGIGIVFDSEPEFKAMLEDSFANNKKGFSFFIDSNKKIIASTHDTLMALDTLEIDNSYINSTSDETTFDYIKFEDKQYIISCAKSHGYREYKNNDNYTNKIYALTFIEL